MTMMCHLPMSMFHLYELLQVAPHPHFLMASFGHLMHCAMCIWFVVADSHLEMISLFGQRYNDKIRI